MKILDRKDREDLFELTFKQKPEGSKEGASHLEEGCRKRKQQTQRPN